LLNRPCWHVGEAFNFKLTLGFGVFARSVNTLVWVCTLELYTVVFSVDEGILLPSTIATVGGGIAINEFLLGELDKISGGFPVSTLDGASG